MTKKAPIWQLLGAVEHEISFVQAGEWNTRTLQAGTGAPLILMHGTGGHLEAYTRNIGPFAQQFRTIAFDFAGHGLTTHAQHDLEIGDYVDQLLALLDALGIERAHLNGESLGGWVAVKFAARHPDRVGSLVLNTPGGTMARPEVMQRIRDLSQAAADDPSDERIRARLEWLMADPCSVTDELVGVRQWLYSRPGFPTSLNHILCLQEAKTRARNLITDEELAAVPHGALVIWTSDDPSGPASAGMSMAEKIEGGEFKYISGAGHWPQWEQSETFNETVLAYLSRHGTGSGS
jgi:2-hydroxy-6-oxonona-2,4-dienedioate hydrolase